MRIAQDIVLGIIAVLGAASIVFVAVVLGFGLRPAEVVSGSMEPTLPVGSIVLTEQVPASELKKGDIVQVPRGDNGTVVTHRIASIEKTDAGYEVTLKGDANKIADPEPYLITSAGLYRGVIPYAGYGTDWIRAYPVQAGVLLLALLVFAFWGRSNVSVVLPNGDVIRGLSKREAKKLVAGMGAAEPVPEPEPEPERDPARELGPGEPEPEPTKTSVGPAAA
ncbi:signal peptidase I [Gryllotalpicola ginsengisoli]|uniref:signal peptidase I n=1 Tax=Gryllotalpicola ginsengisoli TaxID=444608 RepID=UPI0004876BB0|nr:signal peptidase I [Gryllotalpicola ginsengisoli]